VSLLPPLPPADPRELGKLRWRCRRGMKELDVLLARYVEERLCNASNLERNAFKELLETEDAVLYAYCLGKERPPPRFAALVERITATRIAPANAATRRC
jgi:antitoxin CptB